MASSACADTGPLLHLHEVNYSNSLNIFSHVHITSLVRQELENNGLVKFDSKVELEPYNKDQTALLVKRYGIHDGEASVICLAKDKKISTLLTDDLNARFVASDLGLQPVGSIGILLRAFREKVLSKKQIISALKNLHEESSLFVTSALIQNAIDAVNKFKE